MCGEAMDAGLAACWACYRATERLTPVLVGIKLVAAWDKARAERVSLMRQAGRERWYRRGERAP